VYLHCRCLEVPLVHKMQCSEKSVHENATDYFERGEGDFQLRGLFNKYGVLHCKS
jgi:hypothetical protein